MDNPNEMTSTASLVYQAISILLTLLSAYVSYRIDQHFKVKNKAIKHQEDAVLYKEKNDKTERLLLNAVEFVEGLARKTTYNSLQKRDLAVKYIEDADPAVINEYGTLINTMVDRKVAQVINGKNSSTILLETASEILNKASDKDKKVDQ